VSQGRTRGGRQTPHLVLGLEEQRPHPSLPRRRVVQRHVQPVDLPTNSSSAAASEKGDAGGRAEPRAVETLRLNLRRQRAAHRGLQLELVGERHARQMVLLALVQQQRVGTHRDIAEERHAARPLRNLPIFRRHAARRRAGADRARLSERAGGRAKSRERRIGGANDDGRQGAHSQQVHLPSAQREEDRRLGLRGAPGRGRGRRGPGRGLGLGRRLVRQVAAAARGRAAAEQRGERRRALGCSAEPEWIAAVRLLPVGVVVVHSAAFPVLWPLCVFLRRVVLPPALATRAHLPRAVSTVVTISTKYGSKVSRAAFGQAVYCVRALLF
jgi:hypothetical protein